MRAPIRALCGAFASACVLTACAHPQAMADGTSGEPAVQILLSGRSAASEGAPYRDFQKLDLPAAGTEREVVLRYEGPALENRETAYRVYLDQRNGFDVFGKTGAGLVLRDHGLPGDDYHSLQAWGMDTLKVGDSLGAGSPGVLVDGAIRRFNTEGPISAQILETAPGRAAIRLTHANWQLAGQPLSSNTDLGVDAASRLLHTRIALSRIASDIVAGVVVHEGAEILRSDANGDWAYIASFGDQSEAGDALGLAVFYRRKDALDTGLRGGNHYVRFAPAAAYEYFVTTSWEQDVLGIAGLAQMRAYLDREVARLDRDYPGSEN